MSRMYRYAEFAQLAGVTVRTLQYYDRIGLLKPSDHTQANYRLYTAQDLLRLQQILWLKWLGFTLAEVKQMVAEHDHDWLVTFSVQKRTIDERIGRLQEVSVMLEQLLASPFMTDAQAGKWPAQEAMPAPLANVSPEVRTYMEEASRIYHQRNKRNENKMDCN